MSWIKDFNELHISTRMTVLNVVSTIPFFFIVTYLFKPELIQKIEGNPLGDMDFYFLVSICSALAISWFLMIFAVTSLTVDYVESFDDEDSNSDKEADKIEEDDDSDLREIFGLTYFYSIAYLSLAIFINYNWLNWSFKWIVVTCFSFILFRILWVLLWKQIFKAIRKNN